MLKLHFVSEFDICCVWQWSCTADRATQIILVEGTAASVWVIWGNKLLSWRKFAVSL